MLIALIKPLQSLLSKLTCQWILYNRIPKLKPSNDKFRYVFDIFFTDRDTLVALKLLGGALLRENQRQTALTLACDLEYESKKSVLKKIHLLTNYH